MWRRCYHATTLVSFRYSRITYFWKHKYLFAVQKKNNNNNVLNNWTFGDTVADRLESTCHCIELPPTFFQMKRLRNASRPRETLLAFPCEVASSTLLNHHRGEGLMSQEQKRKGAFSCAHTGPFVLQSSSEHQQTCRRNHKCTVGRCTMIIPNYVPQIPSEIQRFR